MSSRLQTEELFQRKPPSDREHDVFIKTAHNFKLSYTMFIEIGENGQGFQMRKIWFYWSLSVNPHEVVKQLMAYWWTLAYRDVIMWKCLNVIYTGARVSGHIWVHQICVWLYIGKWLIHRGTIIPIYIKIFILAADFKLHSSKNLNHRDNNTDIFSLQSWVILPWG